MTAGPPAVATAEWIGIAAQVACTLEAIAPKPGNVHPAADFGDARFEDFLVSAAAIGPVLARAGDRGVGRTILEAVRATRRWVGTNTNLGIVLLLAPLAKAAAAAARDGDPAALRAHLARVLAGLDVQDARDAYAAIREAAPGGLGTAPAHDVREPPNVTLREAMAAAADRDAVAREYVTDYAVTFDLAWPALQRARRDGLPWPDAVVETFLAVLADVPDTLVARKCGAEASAAVSREARGVRDRGGVRTEAGRRALAAFDRALRDPKNRRNPGTTADLVAAALFVHWVTGQERRR